jgi:hypothetical protein
LSLFSAVFVNVPPVPIDFHAGKPFKAHFAGSGCGERSNRE